MADVEYARKLAAHPCEGCGEVELGGESFGLSSISMQHILAAAKKCANIMDSIPEGQMIAGESMKVKCDGTLSYLLTNMDNQDDQEERWEEEFQPLTSAKTVAHSAYMMLASWQRSMLCTYRNKPDVLVFNTEHLGGLKDAVKEGDKDKVLQAISAICSAQIGSLPPGWRY